MGGGFAAVCPVPADLVLPPTTDASPAPGRRVRIRLPGRTDSVYHILRLPDDWTPGRRWPVLCEWPGNGPYHDARGDVSSGCQEDAAVGHGLGGTHGCISLVLPCVDPATGAHARQWWGDPAATTAYCRAAVADAVGRFAGDPDRLVLCGFSRGSIALNYLGLRDDAIAALWRAFVGTSHYDGVRGWPYGDGDPASAHARLRRLAGRPQLIHHEEPEGTGWIRSYLAGASEAAAIALIDLPWPNHTQDWLLRDLPQRVHARRWLVEVLR